jgi:5-methylcytosine-specific restriction endonuclease McrA
MANSKKATHHHSKAPSILSGVSLAHLIALAHVTVFLAIPVRQIVPVPVTPAWYQSNSGKVSARRFAERRAADPELDKQWRDQISARNSHPLTDEHRQAISEGLKNSEAFQTFDHSTRSKKTHANMTDEQRNEWRQKISDNARIRHNRAGNTASQDVNNQFTSFLKRQIRKRDGHSCAMCGYHESPKVSMGLKQLVVHHIDQDRSNNLRTNLVTLCRSCHYTGHARGYWPIDLQQLVIYREQLIEAAQTA